VKKYCTVCARKQLWHLADGRYKCQACGHRFRWQSVWASSRLPEATKRKLLERFVLGVPIYRQRFRLSASRTTGERFYRVIRATLARHEHIQEVFDGALECDETMFGGRRRGKRGWGAAGKVIVFGILKRNGQVKVFSVSGRSERELVGHIMEHTRPGSLYYTDDWHAYASLAVRGEHIVIRKEKGQPKGRDHINGIEGFWSYAKHWLYPYRGVPQKFFHLYLGEICYRFNHRAEDLYPLIYKLLKQTAMPEIKPILVRIG
jgi:transposase